MKSDSQHKARMSPTAESLNPAGTERHQRARGTTNETSDAPDFSPFLPAEVFPLNNPQTDIPRIAKDEKLVQLIEQSVRQILTEHKITLGDARAMADVAPASVHLVVTSPPYWTLKEYRASAGQMGHIANYEEFLRELDTVWSQCFNALVPGGRLVCVVGDVCLS